MGGVTFTNAKFIDLKSDKKWTGQVHIEILRIANYIVHDNNVYSIDDIMVNDNELIILLEFIDKYTDYVATRRSIYFT